MASGVPHETAGPAPVDTAVCHGLSFPPATLLSDSYSPRPITLAACKKGLDEAMDESVVSFGQYLFHRCAKCHSLVEHNTNLLLLSDGSPVCEKCSYTCTICQKPIHNEAIVTGDESYHADCFRCRSCSNKIEELIFAKTNQGIWCMACHNDRVARTRRHAEAKRRARKEREHKAGRKSQVNSESLPAQAYPNDSSGVSRGTSSPPSPTCSPEPVHTMTDRRSPVPLRPLPPHPGGDDSLPSAGRPDATDAPAVIYSPTSQSRVPKLSGSAPSPTYPHPVVPTSFSAPPASSEEVGPIASTPTFRPPPLSATVNVFVDEVQQDDVAVRNMAGDGALGLAAPSGGSKAHNRRSGFYGAMARPVPPLADSAVAEERAELEIDSGEQSASPRRPTRDIFTPQRASTTEATRSRQRDPAEVAPSPSSFDSDTLLFLTHVTSPSHGSASPGGVHATPGDLETTALPGREEEQLDTLDSPRAATMRDANADSESSSKPSETARRVRESLQLSQQESIRGSLAELDVELVESLLAELDATQREIKEIKTRYNAFRRASRTAFEGFSLAREEYDKEVAARRDVERQMVGLRAKFAEQARRLAQLDEEQTTADELKRRSRTLRTSVVGMEKQLSQLRAEVALTTAQAAELVSLDVSNEAQNSDPDHRTSRPSSHAEMAEALNLRLEAVKESHRVEISTLVEQRDDLVREIEELKRVRDAHAAEAEMLASRNADLIARNETAARSLDDSHGSFAKMSTPSGRLGEVRSHMSTLSTSSVGTAFSPSMTRPVAPTSRHGAVTIAEIEPTYRHATAETASRNKFWGKGKSKSEASKQPTYQPGVASPPQDKSPGPSLRAATGTEQAKRAHLFQQSSILRPVRCDYCGDKMWGLNEFRCSACGSYAHAKCATFLQTSCAPGGSSPAVAHASDDHNQSLLSVGSMFGSELAMQAEKEGSRIPAVVIKCIEAVEKGGMSYEGIYRKTGGMGQTKLITQNFERGHDFDLSDRDKFNDIAAVTSCLKNYFRSLPIPLMTHDLHEDFISATENPDPNGRLDAIEQVLKQLPPAHYETARHLFLHLNRVQSRADENKMTAANLGVVFGPTVLRSPVAAREWSDMGPKTKLVEILCEHAERLFSPARG
ncbi:hypothetical protein JCM3774_001219 [Rhodotorula dairenensis]